MTAHRSPGTQTHLIKLILEWFYFKIIPGVTWLHKKRIKNISYFWIFEQILQKNHFLPKIQNGSESSQNEIWGRTTVQNDPLGPKKPSKLKLKLFRPNFYIFGFFGLRGSFCTVKRPHISFCDDSEPIWRFGFSAKISKFLNFHVSFRHKNTLSPKKWEIAVLSLKRWFLVRKKPQKVFYVPSEAFE